MNSISWSKLIKRLDFFIIFDEKDSLRRFELKEGTYDKRVFFIDGFDVVRVDLNWQLRATVFFCKLPHFL